MLYLDNMANIEINCISPASSSLHETGSSEEDDVVNLDEDMRVGFCYS